MLIPITILCLLIWGLHPSATSAQTFASGSDGSFGPINITANATLDVPADGVFHATTITVAQNATLTFRRNALNTPVYLLATGDIIVQGTIDVSGSAGTNFLGGAGGPGGFDGGTPGILGGAPGDGLGPGAGLAATAEMQAGEATYGLPFSAPNANDGTVYGSPLLVPLVGGSGGGGQADLGGRGGGGAILLASPTRVHIPNPGTIRARGGDIGDCGNPPGSGSGGAIRLVAPTVSGNGTLDVTGGRDTCCCSARGGPGRIRLDTLSRAAIALTFLPAGVTSVGSFMTVFPAVVPTLDIIAVAGQEIPEGTAGPVQVMLPFNAPTRQSITVQARDFTGRVPITIVLTPESGGRMVIPAEIDMSTGNPAQVTVNVDIPVNVLTQIHAWTR